MRSIGIDPGISGAVALIDSKGRAHIYDTPTKIRKTYSRKKKQTKDYDLRKCRKLLKQLTKRKTKIFIEGVHPFLGSKVSNFLLGRSKGLWEGILVGLGLEYELVPMISWTRFYFGKKKRENKKASNIKRAKKLFPRSKKYFRLKKHDGRADALLIAEYGRRQNARNN
jgi:hypothetical protein